MGCPNTTEEHRKAQIAILEEDGKTWRQKIASLIAYRKEHLGLIGFSSPFCPDESVDPDAEKIAHDVCAMELADLKGHSRDVTNEVL